MSDCARGKVVLRILRLPNVSRSQRYGVTDSYPVPLGERFQRRE